jgi:hypothetical protein
MVSITPTHLLPADASRAPYIISYACAGASGSASKYDIERSKIIRAETISEHRVSAVGWKRGIVRKGKMSGG